MIAKHVPMESVDKSNFADLADYITDDQDKNERVGRVAITNCHSDSMDAAVLEILNTQDRNKRTTSDKTFHLLVSFRAGESPSEQVLKEIESKICDGLGFGDHQRVSAVHHDTNNLHIHIAINKIHPERYTIHDPYYGHKVLSALCDKLEDEYGLLKDNHIATKSRSENRVADMEHHSGIESLVSWIRNECKDQLNAAKGWGEFHDVLGQHGLTLKERGNGFVISNADGLTVKASTVAREFSKAKLVERFGGFQPCQSGDEHNRPKTQYKAAPLKSRVDTTLLFAQYNNERLSKPAIRTKALNQLRDKKQRQIEQIKRAAKIKRAAIKLSGSGRHSINERKLAYAIVAKQMRAEIAAINKQFARERDRINETHRPLQWADWLRAEAVRGNADALAALRARENSKGLKGNTFKASGKAAPVGGNAQQDGITKTGNIIYRSGKSAIRDDGAKLSVSRGTHSEGLVEALKLAMNRYGDRITVNGNDQFKTQIIQAAVAANLNVTFADPALESRRQALVKSMEKFNESRRGTLSPNGDGGRGTGAGLGADPGRAGTVRARGTQSTASVIAGIRTEAPPAARGRLRDLSSLDVVRDASRGQMLLQDDVSSVVEHQGTKPDSAVRRPDNQRGQRGIDDKSIAAAMQYIQEREDKRAKIFDILTHRLYNSNDVGAAEFAGIRRVNGYPMALLKRDNEVIVTPLTEAAAIKLGRVSIGDNVSLGKDGLITKSKGRSR